jgi:hypothetical protein
MSYLDLQGFNYQRDILFSLLARLLFKQETPLTQ